MHWLGLQLDQHYERVEAWLSPVTSAVIAAIVVAYVWRVIRYKPDGNAGDERH